MPFHHAGNFGIGLGVLCRMRHFRVKAASILKKTICILHFLNASTYSSFMFSIMTMHAAEARMIQQLQTALGLWLQIPMQIVSFFASEAFVIAIVPAIYWCYHRKKGAELGLLILGSAFINLWIKQLLAWPRPFQLIPSIGLAHESTYGMPSGHSQLSIVFWAFIVQFLPKKWRVPVLIAVPLIIGFSRIYLGVHFITDVLGGYLVGILFFLFFKAIAPHIERMLHNSEWRIRVVLAAALSFVMNLLLPNDTMISGAFLGASVGFAFAARNVAFSQSDALGTKALRYAAGLASTGIMYLALKLAAGPIDAISAHSQEQLIRFIRYTIIGGWISLGAPFLFLKLKLARQGN